jgi:hypothetical protein
MSEEKKETVAFTIRNVSLEIDKAINAISLMEGKSKNTLLLDLLEREFSNPISLYGRKSALVKAMDEDVCQANQLDLIDSWYENEHIIMMEFKYKDLLEIDTEEDLDVIFKRNIPLIDFRAKQLLSREPIIRLPRGISLTFALFAEIARRDEETIRTVNEKIFYSKPKFIKEINEFRKMLMLHQLDEVESVD